jgi:hypothetical protein
MTTRNLNRLLAIGAAGLGLSNCVDPYYTGGTSVTTYSPGCTVPSLPSGYATVTVGGTRYYRHDNVYFRPRGNGYVVVEAPDRRHGARGDRHRYDDSRYVTRLPHGYRTVRHDGRVYHQSGDTYYVTREVGHVMVPGPF